MPVKGKKRNLEDNVHGGQARKRLKSTVIHRSHGCSAGMVLACGEGDVGQLGLGEDVFEKKRPAPVNISESVIQVCAGGMHTVCLTNTGELYTFGCNDEGALGRDTSEEGSETLPGKVDLPVKVVQVSAGDSHTAALSDVGKVYAWGNFRDANGSMGLTKAGICRKPMLVLPDELVIKITSGSDHLVCLTDKGELYSLGCAEQGQLGRVAECFAVRGGRKGVGMILNPGLVRCKKDRKRKLVTFSDVWTGQYMTFGQEKDTGEIYGWGLNNYYQLGFDDMENRFIPQRVSSFCIGRQWQSISGGQHHTVALDTEGKVYCLGRADYGRLGIGENPEEKSMPTMVPALQDEKCVQIAAGGCVSFAIDSQGAVHSWGMGTSQQLGMVEDEDVFTPVKMGGKQLENRTAVMVDAGGQHTVLLVKEKKWTVNKKC